jgi:RHS repeat-associated protein
VAENVAYAYDAANRVLSVTPSGAGTSTTLVDGGDTYAWDALSRPTRLERGRAGAAGLDPELAIAYPSYDLGSRPAAEVVGGREPLSWTWDAFGNPTKVRLPSGTGRGATGAFLGFERGYDTLDRLTSTSGLGTPALSVTELGAAWAWGGASRLYGMTTRGALGTGMRLGYHGGAGPQVHDPSSPLPGSAAPWKLGQMSWGSVPGSAATAAPTVAWGDFGFGWRVGQGKEDGAKLGRAVLGDGSGPAVLSGLGWAWGYDGGVRLSTADAGAGSLVGVDSSDSRPPAHEHFTFAYGAGDEKLWDIRQSTGETVRYTTGPFGRITARDGAAFTYDPAGRRLEDDRFVYRWDWRGQLVEVTVKPAWPDANGDGEPDASPYAGHRVSYTYDARGRLLRRLHEGEAGPDGVRPFIEERRYVWEGDRLTAEAAYGPADTGENLRWRKTYVPGPAGLDDAPQVVVEVFAPGPLSGTARTYTYLTDELGTVMGLVAEDEGTDPQHPPVPVRYRYTPYGQAHAEVGPELLRALADAEAIETATAAGTVTQEIADETTAAPGALVLTWSLPLAAESLADGLVLERLVAGTGWQAVPAADLAVGTAPAAELSGEATPQLRVMLVAGWSEGTSYRLRLTPALEDRLGRSFAESETLYWSIPTAAEDEPVPAPSYDQRFPTVYDSYQAATATAGARFPGGQTRLFQGLWTDPVTGMSYARARWLDTRTATWLSEDPLLDVDSPNLYAFVGWQPTMGTDPMGECLGLNDTPCMETVKSVGGMVVGTAESAGEMALGLATAPVVVPYREIKRGVSEAERIYGAYQEGGFEAAFAEDRAIRGERFDDAVETLVSLVPGVNTYRQGAQIVRTYEQEGSFAGGRQVGRTTFSLGLDATVVYGAARAARGALLGEAARPTLSQVRALRALGVDKAARRAFFQGEPVGVALPTAGGKPTVGYVQLRGRLLRAGIGSIEDRTGGGLKAFFDFRASARQLGRTLGAQELELSGALVVNPRIEAMLLRQGFTKAQIRLPAGEGPSPVGGYRKVFPLND